MRMAQSQILYGTPLGAGGRPCCPICQIEMWLARKAPGRLKMELHTFECVSCGHVHRELVAADHINYPEALGLLLGKNMPQFDGKSADSGVSPPDQRANAP